MNVLEATCERLKCKIEKKNERKKKTLRTALGVRGKAKKQKVGNSSTEKYQNLCTLMKNYEKNFLYSFFHHQMLCGSRNLRRNKKKK